MKRINLFTAMFILMSFSLSGQNPTEIIRQAEQKFRGEKTSQSTMNMKIIRPTWERTITMKNWSKGRDKTLTLITAPAREEGQTFLKLGNEMWNWNPTIQRMIKLPPSMMSQGWMGSDWTNEDVLQESELVTDYDHSLLGTESIQGYECYKIELQPHEDAAVVWGKIIMWISEEAYMQLKAEYYDEDGYLVRTITSSDVQNIGGRNLPTHMEIIPADENGHKTIIEIKSMIFNEPISDGFFSQQNMKRVR